VQRAAREMLRALDDLLAKGNTSLGDVTLLLPPDAENDLDLKTIGSRTVGRLSGHLWEQVELPLYARGGVLWGLCNTGPFFHKTQIITIHDAQVLIHPENFSPLFRTFYRLLWPWLGNRAKSILTVSNFSKSELVNTKIAAPEKIRVVPNGADHILRAEADARVLARHGLEPKRYVLAIGSLTKTKNLSAIVEARHKIKDPSLKLALAGLANAGVFKGADLPTHPESVYLGFVDDGELRALYENALCLAFPSLYEGFGLPPLEAMTCGCPVVSSTAPALREVCGQAALFCDPTDPDAFAQAIENLSRNDPARQALIAAGKPQAAQFTWAKAAEKALAVLTPACRS